MISKNQETIEFSYNEQLVRLTGNHGDHILTTIAARQTFYEVELLEAIALLVPSKAIIDVGANVGNHAVFLAMFTDCRQVIAVEPNGVALQSLHTNIKQNNLQDRIQVHEYAAGNDFGRCSLRTPNPRNLGATCMVPGQTIDVKPLDALVGDIEVDAVKIDVEQHELTVLEGATSLLANQAPHLFLEAQTAHDTEQLTKFLGDYSYSLCSTYYTPNGTPTHHFAPV